MTTKASFLPGRVAARLARQVEVGLAQVDLSLSQYRTLMLLDEGSAAASALADHLAVSRPSVTAVVDGLVARGLVERKPRRRRPAPGRAPPHRRRAAGLLCQADRAVEARLRDIAGLPADEAAGRRGLRRSGAVADRAGRLPGGQEARRGEMSLATRIAAGRRVPDGLESGSPWMPVAVEPRYEPPHATIDPDSEQDLDPPGPAGRAVAQVHSSSPRW